MSSLIFHSVREQPVGQRTIDGYINATALCKAAGKRWDNYIQLKSSTEYLHTLSLSLGCEIVWRNSQGIWVHPQVAIHLAAWLAPDFAVAVIEWVVKWHNKPKHPPKHPPIHKQFVEIPFLPDEQEPTPEQMALMSEWVEWVANADMKRIFQLGKKQQQVFLKYYNRHLN